jgi:glutamate--cysteine ligase
MIWRDTDPDRCGQIPFVFDPDFGYERYARWALDVPLFFVLRDKRYEPGDGTTFRQFMERGFRGMRPTMGDWETHLTTLFPDVRLKQIVEVRGADTAPLGHLAALAPLWKGLYYDSEALAAAFEIFARTSIAELDAGQLDVAKRGLRAEMGGSKVVDLARELLACSAEGLRRIAAEARSATDETALLDPLREQIEKGVSPGEEILERWRGEWNRDWSSLIEATRF